MSRNLIVPKINLGPGFTSSRIEWELLRESWAVGENWAVWDLGVKFQGLEIKLLLFVLNQNFGDFSEVSTTCSCWIAAN